MIIIVWDYAICVKFVKSLPHLRVNHHRWFQGLAIPLPIEETGYDKTYYTTKKKIMRYYKYYQITLYSIH